jgi:hypothetical protein
VFKRLVTALWGPCCVVAAYYTVGPGAWQNVLIFLGAALVILSCASYVVTAYDLAIPARRLLPSMQRAWGYDSDFRRWTYLAADITGALMLAACGWFFLAGLWALAVLCLVAMGVESTKWLDKHKAEVAAERRK